MSQCLYKKPMKDHICALSTKTRTRLWEMVCFPKKIIQGFLLLHWSRSVVVAFLIGRCLCNLLRCHSALLSSLRNLAEAASYFAQNAFSARIKEDHHCLSSCAKHLHFFMHASRSLIGNNFFVPGLTRGGIPRGVLLKMR